ncbi:alpha/beta hydrolase [Novosphingobium mangrovi (ex Huang et al. 2023)]|uniref:Alpha/beta hydrolase n=1 Tax=Novosphingobium mangrovi (ex Huang et al. 2023) TaxID=2976432 RepID=A0ABT2I0I4_9SPHN|nr:alpha/beta hydrolase [Novosphingobium mangrovi (ex Huang et al. 2023)]MCT2398112.1 alpha/beta hydrolase [Novosphingobium mangrovi (ex Huang et al. 2023)]
MRSSAVLLGLLGLFAASPLSAQTISYEDVELDADQFVDGGERNLPTQWASVTPLPAGVAVYGPFRVLDGARAALVDVTDSASPAQFAAMLRDYPGIAEIEMIDCPGTEDDLANLRLGRMIREKGIATHVPDGGSVRSGGVELFLAGARRFADPGAEFAVHSWIDDTGLEPDDYAASAPENRRYIDYYRQMGMSPLEAQAFYDMTNSVPFESAKWFGTGVMGLWVNLDRDPAADAGFQGATSLTLAPRSSNGARL